MMNTDSDNDPTPPVHDHPSAGDMAAYIDGVTTDEERQRLDAHLSECARCREELVVVRDAARSKRSRFRWVAGAVATAAAIALLLLTPAMIEDGSRPTYRGHDSVPVAPSGDAVIDVVAPADDAGGVDPADLRFVWRSVGPDAQYRFIVTTAAGDPIARVTTSDTVIASLEDAELAPDTEYYWWVDALRADRATVETGLQRFRTAP